MRPILFLKSMGVIVRPLAAAAAILLAGALPGAAATFALVHGAFVGGWYWDPVAEDLRARGHRVVAVDLTGHGTRSAESDRDVSIEDHIRDVTEAIRAEAEPVVLVAHSYGGRPATGAWDTTHERVAAVVFVEAAAPCGTGPLALPFEARERLALEALASETLASGLLPPPAELERRHPGRTIMPQSIDALHGAVPLTRGPLPDTPGAYVLGAQSRARLYQQYAKRISDERGWTVYEIESDHDLVHDAGEVLTRLLDELAGTLPKD